MAKYKAQPAPGQETVSDNLSLLPTTPSLNFSSAFIQAFLGYEQLH